MLVQMIRPIETANCATTRMLRSRPVPADSADDYIAFSTWAGL
jgi:hypothetical protein